MNQHKRHRMVIKANIEKQGDNFFLCVNSVTEKTEYEEIVFCLTAKNQSDAEKSRDNFLNFIQKETLESLAKEEQ